MLFTTNLIGVTKGIISLLQNPGNILSVYDIEDGLKESWLQRLSWQYVKRDRATAQIIAQRYLAASPCLETLLKLPEDSLGYHYATHLISLNFDPNFYRSIQVNSDTDYLLLRLRQTHEIWHIVTGFGVDVTGELQLKAFELSQTRRPLAIVLLLGGLFGALFSSPLSLASLWEEIVIAYNLGKNTRFFGAKMGTSLGEIPASLAARIGDCPLEPRKLRFFGLCYAMDGSYKGFTPYIERHCFDFCQLFSI